jgi:hypothetical protein
MNIKIFRRYYKVYPWKFLTSGTDVEAKQHRIDRDIIHHLFHYVTDCFSNCPCIYSAMYRRQTGERDRVRQMRIAISELHIFQSQVWRGCLCYLFEALAWESRASYKIYRCTIRIVYTLVCSRKNR